MRAEQQRITFSLHNSLAELNRLSEKLDTIGEQWKLDGKTILHINLALDEIFTNVVSYGLDEKSSQLVTFFLEYRNDEIEIIVSDSGKAFDLTREHDPDLNLSLEEQKIGGLGIFLVRQYTDTITYKREGGKNILTLTKKI